MATKNSLWEIEFGNCCVPGYRGLLGLKRFDELRVGPIKGNAEGFEGFLRFCRWGQQI